MYKTVLLDLDGTLSDPGLGITNSAIYALKKFGIEAEDRKSLYKFVGPTLTESFSKFYNFSEEECVLAIKYFREYFGQKGLYENVIYKDTVWLLSELKKQDKTIILATSKAEKYAVKILEYFGIEKYFDFIAGASMDGSRSRKGDVIVYGLENCGITDFSSCVMVGDREHDVLGAKQAGIDSIGVLFGYGNRDELKTAGATYIAETMQDILSIVSKQIGESL